jgi:hypothetical protein
MTTSTDPRMSELFTIKDAAKVLDRREYDIWWHTTKNVKPYRVGRLIFLTPEMLKDLVEHHLRLKPGETKELLLQRIAQGKTSA